MKRVLLLGAGGMLGSAVYDVLKNKYDVIPTTRLGGPGQVCFDAMGVCADYDSHNTYYFSDFFRTVGPVDYVINAIGVTIPNSKRNKLATLFVNGAFPHILAKRFGNRLIHITTDCVYSGTDGCAPYTELSMKSPTDLYGISKSLGEPTNCITIRTSIVGRELSGFTGLLEWFLKQRGKVVGYSSHLWNGITTHQFGIVCDKLMSTGQASGIYHVFSDAVTKEQMLRAFQKRFKTDCDIVSTDTAPLDRTLSTVRSLNNRLAVPSFEQMITEMP